jgi:anti-sigma regulatory factor (Ser/Thr protein kinase)/anti-anti-sigma regulatory factor
MKTDTVITPTLVVPANLSDDAVARFDQELKLLLTRGHSSVALDTGHLDYVTSSHIKLLWQAYHLCLDSGATMKLESLSAGLVRVLKVLDLHELFVGEHGTAHPQLRKAVREESGDTGAYYVDEFTANSDGIDNALDGFLKFLKRFDLTDEAIFELRTVFYEVVTNIRLHSRAGADELIVFATSVERSRVVLIFADSGISFNPETRADDFDPHAASEAGATRGFGLALVRRLTDKMSYVRVSDAVNVLTLERNRK